jgi:hypothetical protein
MVGVTARGGDGRSRAAGGPFTIGPRTTMHALLVCYPFLREELLAYGSAFSPLAGEGAAAGGWARVTTLNDVAVAMDVPWCRLARDVREFIAAETGDAPPMTGPGAARRDDARLQELRRIVRELEDGGPLLELAERLRSLTAGLDAGDAAALERALAEGTGRARDEAEARVMLAAETLPAPPPPPGHPLDTQLRGGRRLRALVDELAAALSRMGGSPSRRRWRSAKPMVQRLIERIADLDTMSRSHGEAWLPALAAHGAGGLAKLLADRETEALELLRRLRLALARDDAAFVADAGSRLVELIEDLLGTYDLVLVPLAERHLSVQDWADVRRREDRVGFAFVPVPPPWPETGPGVD